jgi:hypothetical protein
MPGSADLAADHIQKTVQNTAFWHGMDHG